MKGNYGAEADFNAATHNLSQSTGVYDGALNSCPYVKDSATNYEGTVYVVSGSAGQLEGEQPNYPHDALPFANSTVGGSMILEVKGNRLDAKWICADGVIRDKFTMMKDVNKKTVLPINPGQAVTLTASFNSGYNWQGVTSSNKSVAVSPADTTIYSVSDINNCLTDTFIVQVAGAPLPVTWGYVKASHYDATSNLISWQTIQEKNSRIFELERSLDGISFSAIGSVHAGGNTSAPVEYNFMDKAIVNSAPAHYYRIRQIDIDGLSTYSTVVHLANGTQHYILDILVAPNPSKSKEMQISVKGGDRVKSEISVTDLSGKVLHRQSFVLTEKGQVFLPELKSGVYVLSVMCEGNSSVRKIVIP